MANKIYKYQADGGSIRPIRMSDETSARAGAAPAGEVSNSAKVYVTKSARRYGTRARGLVYASEFGTAPDTFQKYIFIPVLTPNEFAGLNVGSTLTYKGKTWTAVSKLPEKTS